MKVRIKSLIKAQIYILLIVGILNSILGVPSTVKYLMDINFLVIFGYSLVKKKIFVECESETKGILSYWQCYIFVIVLIGFFKFVPIGQLLWGIRNTYFFVGFLALSVYYLSAEDIETLMQNVVRFQVLNVICGLYEYYVLNVHNDYLGGIFGVTQGCNGLLNMYLIIIVAYVVSRYMKGKESLSKLGWITVSSIYMAAISELKIFYIELVVIIALAVLIGKKSYKTIIITFAIAIVLVAGLNIMVSVNQNSIKYMLNYENLIGYGSRTDYGNGDIRMNRLTAIAQVDTIFFDNSFWNRLFGFGLGSCESSATFSWCNSEFADRYSYLQYRNFGSSMIYLETGLVGLIGYMFSFILIFIDAQKKKAVLQNYDDWATFAQIVSVMCIANIFYDSALKREIAYLAFVAIGGYIIVTKAIVRRDS